MKVALSDSLLEVSKQLLRDKYKDEPGNHPYPDCHKAVNQNECSFNNTYRTTPQAIENVATVHHYTDCGKYALWNTDENYYLSLDCGKWSCETCCEKNKKKLEKRLSQSEMNYWNIISHITLTLGGYDDVKNFDEEINKFLTYLRRGGMFTFKTVRGETKTVQLPPRPHLKFFKMKEYQKERHEKTGLWYLHAHFIFNEYLTKYDIIPIWNNCTHSDFNMVEDTHPHNINAGKYLMKYLTKTEYQELFEKGERRYSCSRWKDKDGKWHSLLPQIVKKASVNNWRVMSLDEARQLAEYLNEKGSWLRVFTTDELKEIKKRRVPSGFLPDYNPLCNYGQVR